MKQNTQLGQFFSNRLLIDTIITYLFKFNYINKNEKILNVADLSGGTAGFLTHFQ